MLILISKNICLGLVAALLAKPGICIDHFLKAIIDCHDSGYSKLVCHLVRLLFPFGLESWYMVKCLSKPDEKSTSSMTDQYFSNIMAFYYRAMLAECLASEKLRMKHGFEESLQNSVSNDAGECSSSNKMEPSNGISKTDDGTCTSCNESSSVQSVSKEVFGSSTTMDHAEEENNVSGKLEGTSFQGDLSNWLGLFYSSFVRYSCSVSKT